MFDFVTRARTFDGAIAISLTLLYQPKYVVKSGTSTQVEVLFD